MSTWRYDGGGSWSKIRSIWRYDGGGAWSRIKSVWRNFGGGIWKKVFGLANPYPSLIDGPALWFIESPYTSSANKSIDANSVTGAAFQNSKMYIQRGKWEEDPIYFEVRIQKKDSGGSWSVINPPGINTARFSYIGNEQYSDNDFEKIWPADSSNWPPISLNDIKNKALFRAKFRVSQTTDPTDTELDQLEFHFPSDLGVAPRLAFALNPYADGDLVEDPDASFPSLKVLGLKWRYNTSFFAASDISQLIGKQIIEVTDFNGNVVLGPYDVSTNNFNPQNFAINYTQAMIDSGDEYIINLYVVANDYYYQSGNSLQQHIDGGDQTVKVYSLLWQPAIIVDDPTVTITNRTQSSFDVSWYSENAERYEVDIFSSLSGTPLFGYPKITEDTSAGPFGLSHSTLYSVTVTGLAGGSNQFESNPVTQSVRTLSPGIPAVLSEAYNITANSFKILIENYSDISTFDIVVNTTQGVASRSADAITISSVPQGVQTCVTVTTSKIDNSSFTAQSWELAESNQICTTLNTWYCREIYAGSKSCRVYITTYNESRSGSGYIIACSTDPDAFKCCEEVTVWEGGGDGWQSVSVGQWSAWSTCSSGKKTRSRLEYQERSGIITYQDCSTGTLFEERTITITVEEPCCPVTEDCGEPTYIYGPAWSACVNGQKSRSYTKTTLCVRTNADCSTQTIENTEDGTQTVACCPVSITWDGGGDGWQNTAVGQYTNWSACSGGVKTRTREVQQERTGTRINDDCSTTSLYETRTITETDEDPCCQVTETCGDWVYVYGPAWSVCSNGSQSRSYTRTQICTRTNADCSTGQIENTEDGTETRSCCDITTTWDGGGDGWGDLAIGEWSNWSACSNGTRTRTRSIDQERTGTRVNENCSTTPLYETRTITDTQSESCVSSQWWCKTTTSGGGCFLSGPFSSNMSSAGSGYVTVCTFAVSTPYSCESQPPFFPPHFPPFFPPYFVPPFFPPHFPPFFPPHFPPFFPPYFVPPYFVPPFFPPYFVPPFFGGGGGGTGPY